MTGNSSSSSPDQRSWESADARLEKRLADKAHQLELEIREIKTRSEEYVTKKELGELETKLAKGERTRLYSLIGTVLAAAAAVAVFLSNLISRIHPAD